jgi:acyl-coenzyme A thioesterase 13
MKLEFIEFLKAEIGNHVEGKAAPFSNWLNGKIIAVADNGDIEMAFTVRSEMLNPFQVIHGGAISAILDELMGMQLFIKSSEEESFLALNLAVDFMKSAREGEILTGKPMIVRKGKRTATMTCQLFNAKGDIVAQASSNFLAV